MRDAANDSRSPSPDGDLSQLLRRAFGFSAFRPHQEAVCRAVIEGRDVLLVMPTGAGKSLCYQLPGIARGGTTLVISPLIALMEDQVAKLREQGLAAERIHSGRPRSESRQACTDYLRGRLQFLFVAPERLRVTGFPEMLARRQLSLIAVDEAHCISQWGHDFRPDYRMLGQYLPRFRPAPVMALTATATPLVQDDIVEQLGLAEAERFVRGFRRDNIAIEVVEIAPALRAELVARLLRDEARRPAIVYTPTRKQAESLAEELSAHFPAAAYHAGLDAARRQQVQEMFQQNRIEVTVATIAFGMGIDKADIRTVIHTALPGSMEAYYQEIGRAGRDGAASRAVLMHSYADRHTHDFFLERDYPKVSALQAIFAQLRAEPLPKKLLMAKAGLEEEVFDKSLEKLWTHGGALVDFSDNVSRGHDQWRDSYVAQGEQKRAQLEQMLRYAESRQCRMATLIRHFGDLADAEKPCGVCDFCAPAECAAQRFRAATEAECQTAWQVLSALRTRGARSTGKLHAELCPRQEMSRDEFEELLSAAARAGLVQLSDEVFEKEGRQIWYCKATLTGAAQAMDETTPLKLLLKDLAAASGKRQTKKSGKEKAAGSAGRSKAVKFEASAAPGARAKTKTAEAGMDSRCEAALRAWRMAEARRRGVPAFCIFHDRTLKALAASRPATPEELIAVPGVGSGMVTKYGADLCRILRENPG
jgi:RecQ family ATP-dependent DNA helicase